MAAESGRFARTASPRRFEERGAVAGVPRALENIAKHYFGDLNNTVIFPEMTIPRRRPD